MPFYNGRDAAIVRANFAKAVVVLGSATPALETFHNSHTGKYRYLQLPNRIANRPLAQAEIIDMREVFKQFGKDPIFSPDLLKPSKKRTTKANSQSFCSTGAAFRSSFYAGAAAKRFAVKIATLR